MLKNFKTLKKGISFLLSITILLSMCCVLQINSSAAPSDNYKYTLLRDGTIEITNYTPSTYDYFSLIIPEKLDGYTVSAIGRGAFRYSFITDVTIPDTVVSIGENAFSECSALKNVIMSDSVKSIGNFAFYRDQSLESIKLSENLTEIGYQAFASCVNLQSLAIPSRTATIGREAFSFCGSLKSVFIANGVKSIGSDAFSYCDAMQYLIIPDSVTNFGSFQKTSGFNGEDTKILYCGKQSKWSDMKKETLKHYELICAENLSNADFNNDGYLTIEDANIVYDFSDAYDMLDESSSRNILTHSSIYNSMDMNADSYVTDADAELILSASAGLTKIDGSIPLRYSIEAQRNDTVKINIDVIRPYYVGAVMRISVSDIKASNLFFTYDSEYLEFYRTELSDHAVGGKISDNTISFACADDGSHIDIFFKVLKEGETNIKCTVGTWLAAEIPEDASKTVHLEPCPHTGEQKTVNKKSATGYEKGYTGDVICAQCGEILEKGSEISRIPFTYKDLTILIDDNNKGTVTDCGKNVSNVIIPSELGGYPIVSIGNSAFSDCRSLQEITIPANITRIENAAFLACSSLNKINYQDTSAQWNNIFIGEQNINLDCARIVCSDVVLEPTHAHEYTSSTTEASCTQNGSIVYTCACGESYNEIIPATGHTPEVMKGIPAKCTESGLTDGEKCAVCGKILKYCAKIPATGHKEGSWTIITPALIGKDGKEEQKCDVCGKVLQQRIIPALEPSYTLGDLNDDGKIQADDARMALRISAKLETNITDSQKLAADVDKDGNITASDARQILRVSAHISIF